MGVATLDFELAPATVQTVAVVENLSGPAEIVRQKGLPTRLSQTCVHVLAIPVPEVLPHEIKVVQIENELLPTIIDGSVRPVGLAAGHFHIVLLQNITIGQGVDFKKKALLVVFCRLERFSFGTEAIQVETFLVLDMLVSKETVRVGKTIMLAAIVPTLVYCTPELSVVPPGTWINDTESSNYWHCFSDPALSNYAHHC